MSNPSNFYEALYSANTPKDEDKDAKPFPESKEEVAPAVAQDEAIGSPWTHRFTIYCSNPKKGFGEELKAMDGVVAVYIKEKAPDSKE